MAWNFESLTRLRDDAPPEACEDRVAPARLFLGKHFHKKVFCKPRQARQRGFSNLNESQTACSATAKHSAKPVLVGTAGGDFCLQIGIARGQRG